ncbi:MAG TPA: permease-like cell division protein FtsX [Bacillales bacterium]|nr:permease-like cell division protein FtsX [Bacillales bacterium]
MKLRTLRRHSKEGFKNLGRNGWMTFASVSSVTVALLLVGFFTLLMINLNAVTNQVREDVQVKVFIDRTATQKQIDQLGGKIKSLPLVASVEFVSKKEGLERLIDSMSQNGEEVSVLASLRGKDNPLPHAYVVEGKNPEDVMKIAQSIKPFEYVSAVKYGDGKGTVKKLFHVTDTARNVGLAIIIGLLFTAVFLIGNTIKLTIVSRRTEIEIMKLVGATNGFIRWPFFVEGLLLGILGSILPITLLVVVYRNFYAFFYEKYATTFVELVPLDPTVYMLAGGLLIVGAVIGVWGSVTSVRKFLKV